MMQISPLSDLSFATVDVKKIEEGIGRLGEAL